MKEALKLALEALKMADELCRGHGVDFKEYGLEFDRDIQVKYKDAITTIKEALAQPVQEPVAKVVSTAPDRIWLDLGFDPQDEYEVIFHELHDVTWSQDNASGNGIEYVRADTTPPKRPWVGLTDEDISLIDWESLTTKKDCVRAIETASKEKNT